MQDDALGRADGRDETAGHRVGNRNELAAERPDLAAFAVGQRQPFGSVIQLGFFHTAAGEAEGEGRAVNCGGDFAQQVRERADVIFVAVSGDAAHNFFGSLKDVGEVGQHEIHPRAFFRRE